MPSVTISPSIDQAALLQFEANFLSLAQQRNTKLGASKAVKYLTPKGKTNNMARIGSLELVEVSTRNPDKQYGDYALDNRRFTKRRFTRTITVDDFYDINELIKNPTSDIVSELVNAKNRVIDRIVVEQALGAVLTGAPDAAAVSTSAATDGVITVDATGGLTYEKIQAITQSFINNSLDLEMFSNSIVCLTGKENTALMGEAEFIDNDYISGRPVEKGIQTEAGMYGIVSFAGSENGGITVNNPILPEISTTRSCAVLAPDSVAVSMEVETLEVVKSPLKVKSWDITISILINAMRTEGVRVQKLTTTI